MKPLLVVSLVFALVRVPQLVLAQEAQTQSPATEPTQSQSSPANSETASNPDFRAHTASRRRGPGREQRAGTGGSAR